jgi:hypothetical protein
MFRFQQKKIMATQPMLAAPKIEILETAARICASTLFVDFEG